MLVLDAQSHLTLCNHQDCSPPGSSVQGILQARILEWTAMPSSRGPSRPRDRTLAGAFFTISTIWEAPLVIRKMQIKITMRHYFTPGRMAIIKRQTAKPPLVKMWENWILSLLVGMYNGLATSERSLAVP